MEQKLSNSIGLVASVIYIVAFLLIIIGLYFIIQGLTGNPGAFVYGIVSLVLCPIVWGYAYIVEAACKYLSKQ